MSDKIFFLLMNLDMVDRNSAPEEFSCIYQSKRVGIITIETERVWIQFSCDVFVAVSCRGILNSLIFTKTWSMQAWIPVVSWGLYFRKSVFSFRVDSILKWRVDIKLKVSWLRGFLWCMSQTGRDGVNSRHVGTHKKNSGETVRRLGTIIQSIFCAQSGASIRLTVWKCSGESRYPGALPPLLENFRRAFSPRPTACPQVSEDGAIRLKKNCHPFQRLGLSVLKKLLSVRTATAIRSKKKLSTVQATEAIC